MKFKFIEKNHSSFPVKKMVPYVKSITERILPLAKGPVIILKIENED